MIGNTAFGDCSVEKESKMARIAIHGFGRIGRSAMKAGRAEAKSPSTAHKEKAVSSMLKDAKVTACCARVI